LIDVEGHRRNIRISLSLTDIKTGFVVAQSATRVRGEVATPTAFIATVHR
jgi:hypothetical protein